MYAIALFLLKCLFKRFIGPDTVDYVKMPFGMDLPVGATHSAGEGLTNQLFGDRIDGFSAGVKLRY